MIPTRTIWFAAGVVSGAAGTVYGYARYRETRGRFAADRLADTVSETALRSARNLRGTVLQALDEGRDAMDEAEERILADLGQLAANAERSDRSHRSELDRRRRA